MSTVGRGERKPVGSMSAPDKTVWRVTGAPLVAGTPGGPLAGQSVAVKDLFAVAGQRVGGGVAAFLAEQAVETGHAAVVAELLAAGADVAGIATTDEFAYSITGGNGRSGMPVNPLVPGRVPGGSSSGPAVAVARGEVSIGLGTDTAGSIRVPGAYQGLWGIRTTHGSIDTAGLLPLAPSFDTIGWLTHDSATLAAVADVVFGRNASDPVDSGSRAYGHRSAATQSASSPQPLVIDQALYREAEPVTANECLSAASSLGASRISLDAPLDDWFIAFRTVQANEAWRRHGAWISAHPDALAPEVAQRFQWASTVDDESATRARELVGEAAIRIRDVIADRVLLLPTTAGPPPYRDADAATTEAVRTATLRLTCLASIAGLPAVTVPLPLRDGPPVGLCLIGAPNTDRDLIHLAARCGAALVEPACEGTPS
ncbi:amidase family protein [Nocardia camponoti]|uniref:Amidase n=1 Tax=Nocardia camponoti TaxID=1616106 RepID=A0A917QAW7_9NOCA|nr:amidase family protein [Nocardia camponoti]GGK40122.1 amidase [Nocardia camponoti]